MAVIYQCQCSDGRIVTGNSKWEISSLRQMEPKELAQVLTELSAFARFYESNYYYPVNALQQEAEELENTYEKMRRFSAFCGISTLAFTLAWVILAVVPYLRFSGLTLVMAFLTFLSILFFIPVIFCFSSAQENHRKRLPKLQTKQEHLLQKQEEDIFGKHLGLLIGGHIVSPEYSLSSDAMELMAQALRTGRASNISEATRLCKRKYSRSPIPRIITSLRSVNGPVKSDNSAEATQKSPAKSLNQMQSQGPDLKAVLQLSDYLHAAIRNYASNQRTVSSTADNGGFALNLEEEALIQELRELTPEEQKRIRRVIHSFHTKKY